MGSVRAAFGTAVGTTARSGAGTIRAGGGDTIGATGAVSARGGGAGGAVSARGGAGGADCTRGGAGASVATVGAGPDVAAKFGGAPGRTRRPCLGTVDVVAPQSFIETGGGGAGTMTGGRRALAGLGAVEARRTVAGTGTVGSARAVAGLGKTGALGRGGAGTGGCVTLPGGHDAARTLSAIEAVPSATRSRRAADRCVNSQRTSANTTTTPTAIAVSTGTDRLAREPSARLTMA